MYIIKGPWSLLPLLCANDDTISVPLFVLQVNKSRVGSGYSLISACVKAMPYLWIQPNSCVATLRIPHVPTHIFGR